MKIDLSKPVRLVDFYNESMRLCKLLEEKEPYLSQIYIAKQFNSSHYNSAYQTLEKEAKSLSVKKITWNYVICILLYLLGSFLLWLTGIEALQEMVIQHNVYLLAGPLLGGILAIFLSVLGFFLGLLAGLLYLVVLPVQYGIIGYLPFIWMVVCLVIFFIFRRQCSEDFCKNKLLEKEENKRTLEYARQRDQKEENDLIAEANAKLKPINAELEELSSLHAFWDEYIDKVVLQIDLIENFHHKPVRDGERDRNLILHHMLSTVYLESFLGNAADELSPIDLRFFAMRVKDINCDKLRSYYDVPF